MHFRFYRRIAVLVGLVAVLQPAQAREQWQMIRADAPPASPGLSNVPGLDSAGANPSSGQGPNLIAGGIPRFTSATPGLANAAAPGQAPGFGNGGSTPGFAPGFTAPGGNQFQGPGQNFLPGSYSTPGTLTPASPNLGVEQAVPGLVPDAPPQTPLIRGTIPEFWKQFLGKRVKTGTVLSGILEGDISSAKSQRGDTFAIILPDGYSNEGEELIPPNSRILGVVVDSVPAKMQRSGVPGQVNIGLTTLVFPDGRNTKINGFIQHNPAHDQETEPKVKMAGMNFSDYGQQVKSMLNSTVSGIGFVHARMMRGKEFSMKAGTPVAVRINTPLDLNKMNAAPIALPGQSMPGGQGIPGGTPPGWPPMSSTGGGAANGPNYGPLGPPQFKPAKLTPQNTYIPGLTRPPQAPPDVPLAPARGGFAQAPSAPVGLSAPPALSLDPLHSIDGDPNAIFSKPISTPTTAVPDPF